MTNAPPLTGAMLIGADRVHGSGGELHAADPRTGRRLEPTYGLGGAAEVDRAAELAWTAFATRAIRGSGWISTCTSLVTP